MDASQLKERIDARRKELSTEAPSDVAGALTLTPLHRRAAMLASFTPDYLHRIAGSSNREFYQVLADSRRASSDAVMMLDDGCRREALAQIGTRDQLLATLDAIPDRPDTPTQRILEAYLRGSAPPPHEQSERELAATLTVAPWLRGVLDDIPDPGDVQRALDRTHLLRPFDWLAGEHFRGRKDELNRLRDYVGVHDASTYVEVASRTVREVLSLHESPPLAIHGPGGVGKSTLLARFILDHATLGADQQIPFIYIDFDRPHILASQPATLLLEGVRQLGIQFPEGRVYADRVRADWYETVDAEAHVYPRLIEGLESLLSAFGLNEKPLLLVLDTFEEVQLMGETLVRDVGIFLEDLQSVWPRLRTVVSGRAPIRHFAYDTRDLALGDLDPEAAQGFLRTRRVDERHARRIARHYGGNPLTLRLAADLWHRDASSTVASVPTQRYFLVRLTSEQVQGQLFRRILHHIDDEDVRHLAHPGLVLRRVTPDLIREVLAGPCNVSVDGEDRARELYQRLAREVSLVQPGSDDDAIIHRPDVRRVMLRLLKADRPEAVRRIHEAAIMYYQSDDVRPEERAEEIYHRLALAQPLADVEPRWMEGVEPFLTGALADLDVVERTYLASRLGIEVPDEEREAADLQSWERLTASRVENELDSASADLEAALTMLEERDARSPRSPLFLLEIRLLERMGRLDDADATAERALSTLEQGEEAALIVEVLTARARLAWRMLDDPQARQWTWQALEVARMTDDDLLRLRALVAAAESQGALSIQTPSGTSSERSSGTATGAPLAQDPEASLDALRDELAATVLRLPADVLAREPDLLTDAAGMAGPSNPEVLQRALHGVGLSDVTTTDRYVLTRAIHSLGTETPAASDAQPDEDRPRRTAGLVKLLGDVFQESDVSYTQLNHLLAQLVVESGTEEVRSAIASIFRRAGRERREARQDVLMPPPGPSGASRPRLEPAPVPASRAPKSRDLWSFTGSFFDSWRDRASPTAGDPSPTPFVVDRPRAQQLLQRQYVGLQDALEQAVAATFTEEEIAEVVRDRLGRSLYSTTLATDWQALARGLFGAALQQEWAVDLLLAVLHARPLSRPIQQFVHTHGLGVRHAPWTRSATDLFAGWTTDDARFQRLGALETHTCIVQNGARETAGLLVGPDRVLTTPSAVGDAASDGISVVFDRRWLRVGREAIGVEEGWRVGVQGQTLFQSYRWDSGRWASGDEASQDASMGGAVLHLDRSVGDRPVGPPRNRRPGTKAAPRRNRDEDPVRGWMDLDPSAPTPDAFEFALSFDEYRIAGYEFAGWMLETREEVERRRGMPDTGTLAGFSLLLDEDLTLAGAASDARGPKMSVPRLLEIVAKGGVE